MLERAPARSRPARQRLFQEWTYPHFRAALDELHVDAERNVWVRTFQVSPSEPAEWSVFDPAGRWLGQVETPPGFDVMDIGADYVAGVWKDELDVEHVRVYALHKP